MSADCLHLHARARFARGVLAPLLDLEIRFVDCRDCGALLEGWERPVERYALADLHTSAALAAVFGSFAQNDTRAPAKTRGAPTPTPAQRRRADELVAEADEEQPSVARTLYESALRLDPENTAALVNLAGLDVAEGERERGRRRYRLALTFEPAMAEAHYNLGYLHLDAREIPEAIGCFRRAVECDPELADAHYNLAHAYACHGALDFARQHLTRFLALEPSGTWAAKARTYLADDEAFFRGFVG